MGAVLLQSLFFILVLAALCALIVKRKQMLPAALSVRLRRALNVSPPSGDGISIHQRRMLGWKTLALDVGWQGKRYLLLLQEGRCTVIDHTSDQPVPAAEQETAES